ncbi:MAG: hypothetical protein ACRD5H_08875, partial [Nitrososphaerales archaeon]
MSPYLVAVIISASMLATIGIIAVYASHTYIDGQVWEDCAGCYRPNQKVTAEKAGEYAWTRGDSVGHYLLPTATTELYYVDAMKADHTRDRVWPHGGQTAADMEIFDRGHPNVRWKVAWDASTAVTRSEAVNWLMSAEGWFLEEHSINWNEWWAENAFLSADAANNCGSVLLDMAGDVGWDPGDDFDGAQILIGFTEENWSGTVGGCATPAPSTGGTHPYMLVNVAEWNDIAMIVMHEVSHAYGLPDRSCSPTCGNRYPGIMWDLSTPPNILIKNWDPFDDNTMEQNRWWYCPT